MSRHIRGRAALLLFPAGGCATTGVALARVLERHDLATGILIFVGAVLLLFSFVAVMR
jgi:hypothetical protein